MPSHWLRKTLMREKSESRVRIIPASLHGANLHSTYGLGDSKMDSLDSKSSWSSFPFTLVTRTRTFQAIELAMTFELMPWVIPYID